MVAVELTQTLTDAQKTLLLRYLGEAERFSLTEWVTLLEAFTMLAEATVQLNQQRLTFQAFYDRFIDDVKSDAFIAELYAETDVPARAPAIQAGYAREIFAQLRCEPFTLGKTPETECLLAYCLYWWASFARGSIFELTIFRDMTETGIQFTPHDLRVRAERFSPCDLTLLNMTGDIKNTTYFLYVARSFPLTCDFYITRLYDVQNRCYVRIVVLTEPAWHRINGETVSSDLMQAASKLPQVVSTTFLEYRFVIVEYNLWKQKVLQRQQLGESVHEP